MVYVMSDLHGCYDKFIAMLNKINFCEQDKLFLLGDMVDRGPKSLEIIDYIIENKNIELLKGNHELMLEEFLDTNDSSLWMHNGGAETLKELLKRDSTYKSSLREYIKTLPYIKVLEQEKIILVHAGVYYPENNSDVDSFLKAQEEDICLWDRSNIGREKQFKEYTVICGHTPTLSINGTNSIIKRDGVIYIDCGVIFKEGRLGCLEISNEMREHYID